MKTKNVYIIAGPNGSGKTTFANKFLPEYAKCPNFVNADLIAQGLSPFSPRLAAIKAGKLVLEQVRTLAGRNADFAFETTLSGKSYAVFLKMLRNKGYSVHLFFLWIHNVDIALARIEERVADGGHDVPAQDVKRRFYRGLSNLFKLYRPLLDSWMLFNNSSTVPELIAEEKNAKLAIKDNLLFKEILKNTGAKL
ncbi:MAG: zeta toxin family protein [Candidatus Omnitrophota bacterium]